MMLKDIIADIVQNKRPTYFLSPHLDDAVLSAGEVIRALSDKTKVSIITFFTETEKPYTLSGKMFAKYCGYSDPALLYQDRRKEDLEVCKKIGADAIHMGFVEGLFRKKSVHQSLVTLGKIVPELVHIYPTYKFHLAKGKIAKNDAVTLEALKASLTKIMHGVEHPVVFAPLAVGDHVDHQLIRNAARTLFKDTILWEDFPYIKHAAPDEEYIERYTLQKDIFKGDPQKKIQDILGYRTQIHAMFGTNEISVQPEVYYLPSSFSR